MLFALECLPLKGYTFLNQCLIFMLIGTIYIQRFSKTS